MKFNEDIERELAEARTRAVRGDAGFEAFLGICPESWS